MNDVVGPHVVGQKGTFIGEQFSVERELNEARHVAATVGLLCTKECSFGTGHGGTRRHRYRVLHLVVGGINVDDVEKQSGVHDWVGVSAEDRGTGSFSCGLFWIGSFMSLVSW